MPSTQADIDALDAEIAEVRLIEETEFADQRTKFRPLKDLLALRAEMVQSMNQASGRGSTRYAATSKGC